MYLPKAFEEVRPDVLRQLIHDFPLANLVQHTEQGLMAHPLPCHWVADAQYELGKLIGHCAINNPLQLHDDHPTLVLFNGPNAYVHPSWYDNKAVDGRVVPTWMYAHVQVQGQFKLVRERADLLAILHTQTNQQEATYQPAWKVDDAPADYLDDLLSGIVGFEIPIEKALGKWKFGQQKTAQSCANIVEGLRARDPNDAAADVLESHLFNAGSR